MSITLMSMVFKSALEKAEKMVALAYADHADDDGCNIYPSVEYTAWKTGYSERSVQRATQALVKRGILIRDGDGPNGTNRWRLMIDKLPQRPPFRGGDKMSGGDKNDVGGVTKTTKGGDTVSPKPSENHHKEPSSAGHPQWSLPDVLSTAEFEDAWILWYRHKEEREEPLTQVAGEVVLEQLAEMGEGRAIAAIRHSVAHNWKNIYEPSNNGRGTGGAIPATDAAGGIYV